MRHACNQNLNWTRSGQFSSTKKKIRGEIMATGWKFKLEICCVLGGFVFYHNLADTWRNNNVIIAGDAYMRRWTGSSLDQGLYSLSGKTSYRKISWSLEAARFGFKLFQSLWNLAGTSAALLPSCLSNFRAIRPLQHPISRLRDFTRFGGKTSYRLVNRGPDNWCRLFGAKPLSKPMLIF